MGPFKIPVSDYLGKLKNFAFSSQQVPSIKEPIVELPSNSDAEQNQPLDSSGSNNNNNISIDSETQLPNVTENTRKMFQNITPIGYTKNPSPIPINSQFIQQVISNATFSENTSPESGTNFNRSHYPGSDGGSNSSTHNNPTGQNDNQTHTEKPSFASVASTSTNINTEQQKIDLHKLEQNQPATSVSQSDNHSCEYEPQKIYTNPNIDQLNSKKVRLQLNFSCDFDPDNITLVKIDKETDSIISMYKLVEIKKSAVVQTGNSASNVEPSDKNIDFVEQVLIKPVESLNSDSIKSESEITNPDVDLEDAWNDSEDLDHFSDSEETRENVNFDFLNEPNVQNAQGLPEYNILLLGETGAGKSTTVNAFANYMKYSSFEEAKMGDFVELIPSKFTLPHPNTGQPWEIKTSKWEYNERPDEEDDGGSSTQSPLGYKFTDRNRLIRIIDTPGMGDTRGTEVDKQNFEQILSYLNHHQQLHGIVILIKSSETRTTASFRYCITELLAYLHKSACRNIVFCFTFSRNSLYGPGDGFQTLKEFLKTESHRFNLTVQIKVNCFFIDNEAYRFLVAQKHGYPFTEAMEKMYQESWCNSARDTQALISKIIQLEPHQLTKTTSLHQVRKLIMELAEPMVELEKNIRNNIETIEAYKKDLTSSRMTRQKAQSNLEVEVEFVETRKLDSPKIVCTAPKCVQVVNLKNGKQRMVHKLTCHEKCNLISNPQQIQFCEIMKKSGDDRICSICDCKWDQHKNITKEYVVTKRTIRNEQEVNKIQRMDDSIDKIQMAISSFTKIVKEYQSELRVIQDVAAKFDYILAAYSNSRKNKFIETYLNNLLADERKMSSQVSNYSSSVADMLNQMKVDHSKRVKALSNPNNTETVNLEQIPDLCKRLFVLKHTGPQFRQMIQSVKEGKRDEFKYFDKIGVDLSEQ